MSRRLHRLVLGVLLAALGLCALVVLLVGDAPAVAPLPQLPLSRTALAALLLPVTVAAELSAVRTYRGSTTYEFTLLDAAVVVDVLLLPAGAALLVPGAAMVLISVARRRGLVKTAFNAGNITAATSLLVLAVHTLSGPGQGLSLQTVCALVVGMLAFGAVNSTALAHVLATVGGGSGWALARDGAWLTTFACIATVALGGTAVTVAEFAPALLPFTVLPAVALTFAYRAAAQESEQRERSSRLLALSQVLAGHLDADLVLGAFLDLTRQAFGSDVGLVVLEGEPGTPPLAVYDDQGVAGRRPATAEEVALLRPTDAAARVLRTGLPEDWRRALLAPLEAEGRRLGVVVLATRDRHRALRERELALLAPMAGALAVALRGAAHLARVVEETSKLKAVLDQSSDGILVLDGAGHVQLWSPAVAALSGRSAAEALGRPLGALLQASATDGRPCDPFTAGRALLDPATPQATVELTLRRPDGEARVVRCAHAGAFDDGGALVRDVVIVHDVTRERQVERLKADFIATVSHELRTPVTPIQGYADLLRRRGEQMSPEKRTECLDVIHDRATHLARLVEDLLLASRMSADEGTTTTKVDMADGDLSALVARACADFGPEGDRLDVRLPGGAVGVRCDPVRAIQVLTNLVGNALKYSTPGSRVEVRLAVRDGRAVVEVADEGRGIPADQLDRVFEKFHRVEDPMRMTTGGTGLGLYIARQLALAMDGTLDCRSTLGVGSVFRFTLVLSGSAAVPGASAPAGVASASAGTSRTRPSSASIASSALAIASVPGRSAGFGGDGPVGVREAVAAVGLLGAAEPGGAAGPGGAPEPVGAATTPLPSPADATPTLVAAAGLSGTAGRSEAPATRLAVEAELGTTPAPEGSPVSVPRPRRAPPWATPPPRPAPLSVKPGSAPLG